ncbi:transposase [Candidatus Kuenenbacteria bacterium]|nr:transposase [Candidatus Kuenenbacteria bacterium]
MWERVGERGNSASQFHRKKFWGRHFWARGYLAVSSGTITDEVVQEYIEKQEGQEMSHGEITVEV